MSQVMTREGLVHLSLCPHSKTTLVSKNHDGSEMLQVLPIAPPTSALLASWELLSGYIYTDLGVFHGLIDWAVNANTKVCLLNLELCVHEVLYRVTTRIDNDTVRVELRQPRMHIIEPATFASTNEV